MNKEAKTVLLMVSILLMIGIVMIYSASSVYSHQAYGDSMYFVKRHLAYLVVGGILAIIVMIFQVGQIKDSSRMAMLVLLAVLVIVLVPGLGSQIKGARRWFRFFGWGIQPSELAKIGLILYLSEFTSRKRYLVENFVRGLLPPLIVTGLTSLLILLEPDMGTAVAVFFIGIMLLYVAGARLGHLAGIGALSLPVMVLAVLMEPYRIKRIMSFFSPESDPLGTGFQLLQSFIALGSGGLLGVGLGMSRQKLFFLPEAHTDFIFSIIGEEMGFVGAASILLIFMALIWNIMLISLSINNPFPARVVLGVGVMIAFEVVVNVGVSTGILPTKGLPLPFISYGGSSVVAHLIAIGLVLNMAREAG